MLAAGISDVILSGETKTPLNRVTEAKKAVEANLSARQDGNRIVAERPSWGVLDLLTRSLAVGRGVPAQVGS